MSWAVEASRKLRQLPPDEEMKRFLEDLIPPFALPVSAQEWRRQMPRLRREVLEKVVLRGFTQEVVGAKPHVEEGDILQTDTSYKIRKLRYEIVPGYWIPALLYEPLGHEGKLPVALALRGHWIGGKADLVHQRLCANLARRGVMTLNVEFIGMGELGGDRTHANIAHLNLTGMTGVGLFYQACKKGLDVILAQRRADRKRVLATGVSGGGWQTLMISALDTRVTVSVPVAGYTSVRGRIRVPADIGDLEQVPPDLAAVADYQTLTALLAPRPALLILNEKDEYYPTPRVRPVIYDAVKPVYQMLGAEENFRTYSNLDPGTHNYDADNRSQLYQFLNKHFGLNGSVTDCHREDELLPESLLNVGLPEAQETLLSLALKRARKLNANRSVLGRTKDEMRQQLRKVISLPDYVVRDLVINKTGSLSQHLLQVGPLTIPAMFYKPRAAATAELWIADGGRAAFSSRRPDSASHVCAADISGTGENAAKWELQMLLECAGQRMLGVQTAQILALSRWVRQATGVSRLNLVSVGLRTYIASLVAAALEPQIYNKLTTSSPVASLAELIEIPCRYNDDLPLFCVGLLEVADIRELKALLPHVALVQPDRNVLVEAETIALND